MPSYVLIAMYGLRLFIVVLQDLHSLLTYFLIRVRGFLKSIRIPSFVLIGCCVSELHGHICPIVMYSLRLFIVVLQELHCLPNCLYAFMIRVIGCYHVTKFRYSTPSSF